MCLCRRENFLAFLPSIPPRTTIENQAQEWETMVVQQLLTTLSLMIVVSSSRCLSIVLDECDLNDLNDLKRSLSRNFRRRATN